MTVIENTLSHWHRIVREGDPQGLTDLLHPDAVFHSPVVHTPQRGRERTLEYLSAAMAVLGPASFRYVREIVGDHDAMLEFEACLDGTEINGVDLIRCDGEGRIVEFKVMLRPARALSVAQAAMARALEQVVSGAGP